MPDSDYINFLQAAWLIICFFIFQNETHSQAWIIDTPTGKMSNWIIIDNPAQPNKADLVFLNFSKETVWYDPLDINDNYLEIISPSGLRVVTRKRISSDGLFLKNNPNAQRSITWKVDFLNYLNKLDFHEDGNYLITWHLKTSKGYLSAEPVNLFFKN